VDSYDRVMERSVITDYSLYGHDDDNVLGDRLYKCSAVAEMGDRLATIAMGRKLGAVPLRGDLGTHIKQCGMGRGLPSYQVAS